MSELTSAHPSTALSEAPVVAHVTRGGFIESIHHGTAAVTGPDGELIAWIGDPDGPVFPRSSGKLLQALAMVEAGLGIDGAELALACASHSGEPFHLEAATSILAGAGLTPADLQNTPDLPYGTAARAAWIAAGRGPSSLAQNCSGKHAAMLATCVANGWDPTTYRDPGHPLQQAVTATVTDLTGSAPVAIAVDGCGAPIHAVPLAGLARAFGTIAAGGTPSRARVADAVRAHPRFLGGTGREVTALIEGVPGIIAKDGAESVYAAGLPDGRGVAVKIADGSMRAAPVFLAAVLRRLGVTGEDGLAALEDRPVLGHGEPVGAVVAAPDLHLHRA